MIIYNVHSMSKYNSEQCLKPKSVYRDDNIHQKSIHPSQKNLIFPGVYKYVSSERHTVLFDYWHKVISVKLLLNNTCFVEWKKLLKYYTNMLIMLVILC